MSVRVSKLVWDHFRGGRSQRLVMLAFADYADDDGGSIFPSVATLAKKVGCSERTAQRLLADLLASGYITIVANHKGGRPGATRRYRIDLCLLQRDTGVMRVTGEVCDRGDTDGVRGVTNVTHTGDAGDTQPVMEPSSNHDGLARSRAPFTLDGAHGRQRKQPKTTFAAFIAEVRQRKEPLFPESDPVYEHAARVGIAKDFVMLAFDRFCERYLEDPHYSDKTYRCWRSVFRNAVRDNWFGLWCATDGGGCRLTDKGVLAKRDRWGVT